MLSLASVAFFLHAAIETPAAASFLASPERQLGPKLLSSPSAPEIRLVLQNFGGLLLATVFISLVLAVAGDGEAAASGNGAVRGGVALALGTYHYFPGRRAYVRITQGIGMTGAQSRTLGGPSVHLMAHFVCGLMLAYAGIQDVYLHCWKTVAISP